MTLKFVAWLLIIWFNYLVYWLRVELRLWLEVLAVALSNLWGKLSLLLLYFILWKRLTSSQLNWFFYRLRYLVGSVILLQNRARWFGTSTWRSYIHVAGWRRRLTDLVFDSQASVLRSLSDRIWRDISSFKSSNCIFRPLSNLLSNIDF